MDIISRLRELAPTGPVSFRRELKIAEQQAALLLEISAISTPPVPEQIVMNLPHVVVDEVETLADSSKIMFEEGIWRVLLDGSDPLVWRRWTIMHDFKHILDHPQAGAVRHQVAADHGTRRAEDIADAFAAYVYMPEPLVRQEWSGTHQVGFLARVFEVSLDDMQRRLQQLGLTSRRGRHQRESVV